MKIAIIGPSGVGKTSIINQYMEKYGGFSVAKNFTTRQKRSQEDNEFIFVSKEEFNNLINKDFFFEYEHIFDNYYGTPMNNLSKSNTFFNLDINGAIKLKNNINDLVVIFIITPTRDELVTRLQNRKCNSNIAKRIERIDDEIRQHSIADYRIVNRTIDESTEILKSIIDIEKMRIEFNKIVNTF
jgi:guanylate kinase